MPFDIFVVIISLYIVFPAHHCTSLLGLEYSLTQETGSRKLASVQNKRWFAILVTQHQIAMPVTSILQL